MYFPNKHPNAAIDGASSRLVKQAQVFVKHIFVGRSSGSSDFSLLTVVTACKI